MRRYLANLGDALSWCGFALSCLFNAILGGSGNEALCGRVYRELLEQGRTDELPRLIRNHCRRSFERGL